MSKKEMKEAREVCKIADKVNDLIEVVIPSVDHMKELNATEMGFTFTYGDDRVHVTVEITDPDEEEEDDE